MRYRVLVTFVVWMVEATIDPYNSKESTGHPESDNEAYDEKAKKEKRTNDSLIKHLLDVTWKRKPATREVVQSRGKNTNF